MIFHVVCIGVVRVTSGHSRISRESGQLADEYDSEMDFWRRSRGVAGGGKSWNEASMIK